MMKNRTEKLSSTEEHKKYKQPQWRSYVNALGKENPTGRIEIYGGIC